ncbi:MAG: RluA family pseudouridine synthase [Gammaproteobacteria bacterium]|jgi:23S rRNA pseudouridine955/2504/2580 synthase|nr:RluA family pseudouridine synthase [Gammaproteobacteria bacterium]
MKDVQETHQSSKKVQIEASDEGQRLDNFLIKSLKNVPKSRIYRMIRKGEVRINGKRTKPHAKLSLADWVRLPPMRVAVPDAKTTTRFIPILDDILEETEQYLILNKRAGLAVHGGSGIQAGVIEAIRSQRPDLPYIELAHRIDRDTSGLLVLAKKRSFLRRFQSSLREKKGLIKQYELIVHGHWPTQVRRVDLRLSKMRLDSGERVCRVDETGKDSITQFEVIRRLSGMTWLRARPITGRMHQIRVHAAASGHPIIGDPKYGNALKDAKLTPKRMMLHASSLKTSRSSLEAGDHELDRLNLEAPIPEAFFGFADGYKKAKSTHLADH